MFAAQGAWLRFKMALHVMMAWQTKQPHLVGYQGTTHRTVTCWLMCEGIVVLPKAANNTGLATVWGKTYYIRLHYFIDKTSIIG